MPLDKGRLAKALSIGAAVSLGSTLLLTCIISGVFLILSSTPREALPYIMLAAEGLSVFIGGCVAAAINGSRGLIVGMLCGLTVFLILLITGLLSGNDDIGMMTFIRLGALMLCGILGGIKGVNRKEKLHIK